MNPHCSSTKERAQRRAAPKRARIPMAQKLGHFVARGDRPTYSPDEGRS